MCVCFLSTRIYMVPVATEKWHLKSIRKPVKGFFVDFVCRICARRSMTLVRVLLELLWLPSKAGLTSAWLLAFGQLHKPNRIWLKTWRISIGSQTSLNQTVSLHPREKTRRILKSKEWRPSTKNVQKYKENLKIKCFLGAFKNLKTPYSLCDNFEFSISGICLTMLHFVSLLHFLHSTVSGPGGFGGKFNIQMVFRDTEYII